MQKEFHHDQVITAQDPQGKAHSLQAEQEPRRDILAQFFIF